MKALALVIVVFVSLVGSASVSNSGTTVRLESSCLAESLAVEIYEEIIENTLFYSDSAQLALLGLPYRPAPGTVVLVTDSATCVAALAAYNANFAPGDTVGQITAAFIFRIGTSGFVVANDGHLLVLDANFQKLVSLVATAESDRSRRHAQKALAWNTYPSCLAQSTGVAPSYRESENRQLKCHNTSGVTP